MPYLCTAKTNNLIDMALRFDTIRTVGTLLTIAILFTINTKTIEAQEYKYQHGSLRLPYTEAAYHQDKPGQSMLVLYLHPRQARGHNNDTQQTVKAYRQLAHYLDSAGVKAVLVAPQCEESRHWNEYSAPLGKYMSDVVKDFLDDYVANHTDIDPSRIFALGESFGASGVWRLVTDYPNYFAAAMPAVCSPKLDNLKRFVNIKKAAKTPLCLVAGENDEVYGPTVMAPYVAELQQRHCDLNYVILQGHKHYQACNAPFPTPALDWLFSHHR